MAKTKQVKKIMKKCEKIKTTVLVYIAIWLVTFSNYCSLVILHRSRVKTFFTALRVSRARQQYNKGLIVDLRKTTVEVKSPTMGDHHLSDTNETTVKETCGV